jgi:hypothetical protein
MGVTHWILIAKEYAVKKESEKTLTEFKGGHGYEGYSKHI